jgi:hypothetical protein
MVATKITLLGAFVLLPHVSSQNRHLATEVPSNDLSHGVPPRQPVNGVPYNNVRPQEHIHDGGLRERHIQKNADSPPYFLDCGGNPFVKQEEGCPCFSAETISGLMDVTKIAEYCNYSLWKPVRPNDSGTFYAYPSAYFSAFSNFNNSGTLEIMFEAKYDVFLESARTCNGFIGYTI